MVTNDIRRLPGVRSGVWNTHVGCSSLSNPAV